MRLQKLYSAIRQINEVASINHYPKMVSYIRFFQLATSGQYSPVEIFMEDLLNPAWSDEERNGMISKECFLRFQEKINPASHRYLTEDKIAFHHYCTKNNLSVPELVAVFDPNGQSYWENGQKIGTESDLLNGLSFYPFDIIVKPACSCHGEGVFALDFVDGKHCLASNPNLPLSDTFKKAIGKNPDQYILQKRLYSHQALAGLTGNTVLQSLRLITYLDENNQPQLMIRKIKFPKQGSLIDNFAWGINEGRLCLIDQHGVIEKTVKYSHAKRGLVWHDHVEDVNGQKVKFKIPFWEQCVALVLDAQKVFAPLRTIGWDVAVTDDGPYLIEGNIFWDPLKPQEGSMRSICQLLTKLHEPLAR